ncbi:MAG: aminotransferase class I and II, partial [Chitinophagia bacterium]|nr:aminotransferase class I and II [Chitinophagia bacterium]
LGLRIPELVFIELDPAFGRTEPDEEIQDLLKASAGLNLGLHYLQGSITFDPNVTPVTAQTASMIVWLDCLLVNVDRTVRNPNMLWWNKELWLIDHGASLYFHHSWANWEGMSVSPFSRVKDHVLLPAASQLAEVDATCRALLTPEAVQHIVALLPEQWLADEPEFASTQLHRQAYATFLNNRIAHSLTFVNHAINERAAII